MQYEGSPFAARPRRFRPPIVKRLDQDLASGGREPPRQRVRALPLADRDAPLPVERTGVELLDDRIVTTPVSESPARMPPGSETRPAILRQKRSVHIDEREARQSKESIGEQLAICHHDAHVRREIPDPPQERVVAAQPLRLFDRDTPGLRRAGHAGGDRCRVASHGAVGLRDDERNLDAGIEQGRQRRNGEIGRPEKNGAQTYNVCDVSSPGEVCAGSAGPGCRSRQRRSAASPPKTAKKSIARPLKMPKMIQARGQAFS